MLDTDSISAIFHLFVGQIHLHLLDEAEIVFWTALGNVPSECLRFTLHRAPYTLVLDTNQLIPPSFSPSRHRVNKRGHNLFP